MELTNEDSMLKEEYLYIQSVIERFDGRMLTIKTWSVSFSLVALGGAFTAHTEKFFLIASLSALMFWLIEGFWKTFQYAYYDRSGKLEEYFAGKRKKLKPMQIGSSWYANWKKGGGERLVRIMKWPHVYMPHTVVFLLGIALYFFSVLGCLTV